MADLFYLSTFLSANKWIKTDLWTKLLIEELNYVQSCCIPRDVPSKTVHHFFYIESSLLLELFVLKLFTDTSQTRWSSTAWARRSQSGACWATGRRRRRRYATSPASRSGSFKSFCRSTQKCFTSKTTNLWYCSTGRSTWVRRGGSRSRTFLRSTHRQGQDRDGRNIILS